MGKLPIIFIIFSFFISGCRPKDKVSSEFKVYLKELFGAEPRNGTVYVFVPANQCQNCLILKADRLSPGLSERIVIISGLPRKNFRNFKNYFFDKESKMLELNFLDYGNKIVLFDKDKVQAVVELIKDNPVDPKNCPR